MVIKNYHYGNHRCTLPRAQTGAVLLAFILVFIVASSFYLTTKLNTNLAKTQHSVETGIAMKAAKNALIGYAISYPDKVNADEGPGYLPCPDLNNDGSAGGSCSLTGTTSIGRFPYKTLETEEFRDGHGERLWYVVSDNFRNNPKMTPLNSGTAGNSSGDMTVDGYTNIAAVIFSADALVNNQNRISANENDYTHYIEATFTDSDGDAVIDTITAADTDRYILLTKDELMQAVEKRVLGEVSLLLTTYNNTYGAYPWLTPFADPKADSRILYGTHTGSDNATSLTDSTTDFRAWGVKKGDIVRNVTDGSLSVVTVDNNSTVLTVTGTHLGTDNDFDTDDEYYVIPRDLGNDLSESANNTSTGSSLVDDNQEFIKLDIVPGDIIDNFTDGSSGIVETVAADTITVKELTGGTDNDFDDNDKYLVRSYVGESSNGSSALLLEDDYKDFTVMGVSAGDVIVNIEDGSVGRVASLTQTTITANSMNFGLENDFDDNETYILPQYYGVEGTREGLISFHRVGEFFPSDFDVDWNIPELIAATPNATVSLNTNSTLTEYIDNLKQFVQTSSGTSGTITVDIDEGTCVWTLPEIVECQGSYSHASMQGIVTNGYGGDGSAAIIFDDNTKNFQTAGIGTGAIVLNYDDEDFRGSGTAEINSSGTTLIDTGFFTTYGPADYYNVLIRNTTLPGKAQGILSKVIDANTIEVVDYNGSGIDPITFSVTDTFSVYDARKLVVKDRIDTDTLRVNRLSLQAPDIDTNEFYGIKSPAGKLTSSLPHATLGSTGTTLTDTAQDFLTEGILPGDIIHNITDDSWGEITTVGTNTITATLYDSVGTITNFDINESYEVYYSYVNTRRYEFRVRFDGTTVTNIVNESRTRDVCLGYTACTGGATNVSLPFNNLGASGTATDSLVLTLEDDPGSPNFDQLHIYPGHVVVNTTDGSNGIITTRDTNKKVSVNELNDGTDNDFDNGDSYFITAPVVTIKDFDASENEVGSAAVSIPSGGAQGSIKVSNIDYYLTETAGEIPQWFLKNKWHQLMYIAYDDGDSPGGGGDCVPISTNAGTTNPCVTMTNGGSPNDNKRALVISAGEPLALATQDRTLGNMSDYFEFENNDQLVDIDDDIFQTGEITGTFNDQNRVLDTSP